RPRGPADRRVVETRAEAVRAPARGDDARTAAQAAAGGARRGRTQARGGAGEAVREGCRRPFRVAESRADSRSPTSDLRRCCARSPALRAEPEEHVPSRAAVAAGVVEAQAAMDAEVWCAFGRDLDRPFA